MNSASFDLSITALVLILDISSLARLFCKLSCHESGELTIRCYFGPCSHVTKTSLSIKRFWGKRGKMEVKKGERWRRETPDTDAFTGAFHPHTAWFNIIQSKSLPVTGLSASHVKKLAWNKSHLKVWPSSGACVVTILLFSEISNEEFSHEKTQRLYTGSTIPCRDVFSAGS